MVREEGVASLTMEKLADRAGVNKAVLYRVFPNSGAVLVALFDRETAALSAANVGFLVGGESLEAVLPSVVTLYFDRVERTGDLLIAMLTGPAVEPALLERRREWRTIAVENWGRRFAEATGADPADAEDAVAIVMAAIDGALARWRLDGMPRPRVEGRVVAILQAVLAQLRQSVPA